MFKRKNNIEVVPESEYTDFSSRLKAKGNQYASKKYMVGAAFIPAVTSFGLIAHRLTESTTTTSIPVSAPVIEPVNVIAQAPTLPINITSTPEIIPTGFIADSSLEMLANVLDPVVQILVAISFPIASVIMIGACFFFMFGNSEKAWGMIMNAGLGYVLIQLSPLFLEILRQVGEAV